MRVVQTRILFTSHHMTLYIGFACPCLTGISGGDGIAAGMTPPAKAPNEALIDLSFNRPLTVMACFACWQVRPTAPVVGEAVTCSPKLVLQQPWTFFIL